MGFAPQKQGINIENPPDGCTFAPGRLIRLDPLSIRQVRKEAAAEG